MVASGSMSSPRILTLCFVAFLVAGCSYVETTPPPPTPADFGDTVTRFVTRGIQIDHVVAGDAGCADNALQPTAIAFNASGLDQATPVKIYFYVFADRATFERLRATVDACAQTYVTDPNTYQSIEQSPYVLSGQGPWGQAFEAALRAGLLEAAGTGG